MSRAPLPDGAGNVRGRVYFRNGCHLLVIDGGLAEPMRFWEAVYASVFEMTLAELRAVDSRFRANERAIFEAAQILDIPEPRDVARRLSRRMPSPIDPTPPEAA